MKKKGAVRRYAMKSMDFAKKPPMTGDERELHLENRRRLARARKAKTVVRTTVNSYAAGMLRCGR